ncbi:hypothetical protein M569_08622, partial [Genlisea aurea]
VINGKGSSRPSSQRVVFELKQRVAIALNKVADRDTYQLGVEELDKIVECLTPDLVAPLLSCILDTDSEKKSAVRKECIRLMGSLARCHGAFTGPYLGKMVASIVKRLKDSDSVVRDACIETVGVLASKLSRNRTSNDGVFIAIVRPLFESLGEQNKQVQSGSALCLSRAIDTIHDPPPHVLQKMLERTVKLLKNSHFMGKPELIELNKSIILAGGAPAQSSLTAGVLSIQESLKSSDWKIRKAACSALADIASSGATFLSSYRSSCIRSLESCRFDKVKPVRDMALQAQQNWRNLPGANTPEPSDAGSSVKETYYRDEYGDITSSSESKLRDSSLVKFRSELIKKRVPLSSKRSGKYYNGNSQNSKTHDWPLEIAVPNHHQVSVSENRNDETECSSVTRGCEMKNGDTSDFDTFPKSNKLNVVSAISDDPGSLTSSGNSPTFAVDEISVDGQRNLAKIHDRRSLGSTVTESMSHAVSGFFPQTENEMEVLKKHLLEIDNKQSNLMDMLQAFTASVMDSVSMVLLKVSNLELVLDKMGEELVQVGRDRDLLSTKIFKRSPTMASSRFSVCTPRPSVDTTQQNLPQPVKHDVIWENASMNSRPNSYLNQNSGVQTDVTMKPTQSILPNGAKSFCSQIHTDHLMENSMCNSVPRTNDRVKVAPRNGHWNIMKTNGDIESAFIEALCTRNESLFNLIERTGPVLELLSKRTASNLLIILASYLTDRRFLSSIIPWLQQLLDLYSMHGPTYLILPPNVRRDLLHCLQEASISARSNPSERKCIAEIRETLHQLW